MFNNNKEFKEFLITKTKETEKIFSQKYRKANGIYFTDINLANYIVNDLFQKFSEDFLENIYTKKFLEPCVGIGNFVFAYLEKISQLNLNTNQLRELLNNIYVCDANLELLDIYKNILLKYSKEKFNILLGEEYFNTHIGKGVIFNLANDVKYISIQDIFPEIEFFDIVITNPPYKNLKAEKTHYISEKEFLITKEKYNNIKKEAKYLFPSSYEGTLNLYKLFVEEIIQKYTGLDSYISLLIPSSILRDKYCKKLRENIIKNTQIKSIITIPENAKYISANQALCNLVLKTKKEKNDTVKIVMNFSHLTKNNNIKLPLNQIITKSNEIVLLSSFEEYNLLNKIENYKKIKDLEFITNLRGELDISINKNYILSQETKYKLLKGKNIKNYFFEISSDFVSEDFINNTKKSKYISKPRIACQQISNINKEKRITFAYIPSNFILGNSCNFITVQDNKYNISLYYLLGLFNSSIINWYFKTINSNNHINNYEIDKFPIPLNKEYISKITEKVKLYIKNKNSLLLKEIDELVLKSFNLNLSKDEITKSSLLNKLKKSLIYYIPNISNETIKKILFQNEKINDLVDMSELNNFQKIVFTEIIKKYKKIFYNKILNHTTFKLSDLDLEMIKNIPEGGNWKNIPLETVQKSKRLSKIRETGGRTTLYGRLDMNKPSYTITTYFNRPGNGTYVHPKYNRVLSIREAARIQSFKEQYYFVGNKSDILKQVGNAVPPLLAYQIGMQIKKYITCNSSIDLFCGAGGMSSGFKDAGITAKLAIDFAEKACLTYSINNPETTVICGDLTDFNIKREIIEFIKKNKIDLICGGPPCQGFSLAGKRFIDDPRNHLFKDFVEIVQNTVPNIVVFENVEGILTFQKGEIYNQILNLFENIGYTTKGKVLLASEYGIPQKRKRVIIIGVRKELNIHVDNLFPSEITSNPETQITIKDVLEDILDIECNEDALYKNTEKRNPYLKYLFDEISFEEYKLLISQKNKNQLKFNF